MQAQVDFLSATIVGFGLCAYCVLNLASHGVLGKDIFSHAFMGSYRLSIEMRTQLFSELGTLHFACIYMGIPAVILVAFHRAIRTKRLAWFALMISLSCTLCFLYAATFTKSNILIFGLELVVAARMLDLIGTLGIFVAAILGCFVLMILTSLIGGSSIFDFALSVYNIIFREASGMPFYMAVFPKQIPYTGLDLGLASFGIGPKIAANLIVYNYMFPRDTWVQGAAPAAAQISAYAQGGYIWSLVTMIGVGFWIAVSGQIGRLSKNSVIFSAFIGSITTCYYLSQADFVGSFNVAYGYKWWLAALALLISVQRTLELALANSCASVDGRLKGSEE